MQTVIDEPVSLDQEHHFSIKSKEIKDKIRYCEQCAKIGYHSYLHESEWLVLCPFHGISLKEFSCTKKVGSSFARQCHALTTLMQSICPYWPDIGPTIETPSDHKDFEQLAAWIERANIVAMKLSQKRIWSDEKIFEATQDHSHKLGQLHTLEPIPDSIRPYLTPLEDGWRVEIIQFPIEVTQEIERFSFGFPQLYKYYKTIAASGNHQFSRLAEKCRQSLTERLQSCCCGWRRETFGFYLLWYQVPRNPAKYWNQICACEVAIEEFELKAGDRLNALSRYHRYDEKSILIANSHSLFEEKLLGPTPDANISPEGFLYQLPQVWPCMEWIGTPLLNSVMDQVAQFEVQATFDNLTHWLISLEEGMHPLSYRESQPNINLLKSESELILVKWSKDLPH